MYHVSGSGIKMSNVRDLERLEHVRGHCNQFICFLVKIKLVHPSITSTWSIVAKQRGTPPLPPNDEKVGEIPNKWRGRER